MPSYSRLIDIDTILVFIIIKPGAILEVVDRGYQTGGGKECECERDLSSHVVEWG